MPDDKKIPGPQLLEPVTGVTPDLTRAAVTGSIIGAFRTTTSGLIAGPNPFSAGDPVGVFGRSEHLGVFGFADTAQGIGVAGNTNAGTGTGVHGHTSTGVGVLGTSNGSGAAGRFEGDVAITGNLSSSRGHFDGNVEISGNLSSSRGHFDGDVEISGSLSSGHITCDGDIVLLNQDLTEDFNVAALQCSDPGSVMVIGDDGKLLECQWPYDKRVAGVIAGAGEFRPAVVLGRRAPARGRLPVALVGKVSCKVDAAYGSIAVGDLLTTSPTSGHAMRASDRDKSFGTVIGKALSGIAEGRGLIPILVALQ